MTTINQLSAVDSVVSSDQVPIYSSGQGDARKASMSVIKSFVLSGATTSDDKVTQYAAPTATGFTVTVNNSSDSVWLILTPLAGYAAGTLVLPAVANCVDRQEILFNTTQAVTTLTINANGATVIGAPTTLAANAFFRLRFDDVLNTWYRVG
ncbi:MAG: hypothetical protein ING25_11895 [Burkholderiales bacterium]|nr:hypothetical protein [Burkholderiales bacterium]